MLKNISITAPNIKNAEELINLQQTTLWEQDNILQDPNTFQNTVSDEKEAIKLLNKDNNIYLIAKIDNQIAGYAILRGGIYIKNKHTGTIEIFILPEFRGQGVGKILLEELIKQAKKNKITKRIEIEVWNNNKPAINLYKKLGFKIEGQKKKAYKIKSKYIDSILMSKIF